MGATMVVMAGGVEIVVVEEVVAIGFCVFFLIILISPQYNFKCSKNYRSFDVGCILKWGGIIDKVGF